jgi:hypothetical protein
MLSIEINAQNQPNKDLTLHAANTLSIIMIVPHIRIFYHQTRS